MNGKIHNHLHHNAEEKTTHKICQGYIEALEEERCKIQVFQRELPLCLELVTQAIESCKQQFSGTAPECFQGQSECSEQTSSEMPVLEEFMPVKRNPSCDDDDDDDDDDDEEQEEEEEEEEEEESDKPAKNYNYKSIDKSSKKSDWLKSVQLWNQTPDLPPIEESSPRKVSVIEVKRNGNCGAFHPFKKEKSGGTSTATNSPCSVPAAAGSSSTENAGGCSGGGGGGSKEDKEGQSQRKARRCWSPELHRRFLNALQQLGGSHVATPKQIRELMKVDGLTNDEVKSHLQKYRLHTRRPAPPMHNDNNPQQPQFVVVGGIWVPPPEYAAVATATTTTTTPLPREESSVVAPKSIYAPIAAPPPPPPVPQTAKSRAPWQHRKQLDSDKRASRSHDRDRGARCNSSANSSSARTSTASLAF